VYKRQTRYRLGENVLTSDSPSGRPDTQVVQLTANMLL
jgi:hypothetical protein